MSAVFQCDLCGKLDATAEPSDEFCNSCDDRLYEYDLKARSDADKALEEQYGFAVKNQVRIINLIRYLLDGHREGCIKMFGTQGVEMMEEAVKSTLGTAVQRIQPQHLLPLAGMSAVDGGLLELAAPALGITAGRWS